MATTTNTISLFVCAGGLRLRPRCSCKDWLAWKVAREGNDAPAHNALAGPQRVDVDQRRLLTLHAIGNLPADICVEALDTCYAGVHLLDRRLDLHAELVRRRVAASDEELFSPPVELPRATATEIFRSRLIVRVPNGRASEERARPGWSP